MKNLAQIDLRGELTRGLSSPPFLILTLMLLALFLVGVGVGLMNPAYSAVVVGAVILVIILLLRLDEITATLIIAVHILLDSYLGVGQHQIALILAVVLLGICYVGRSPERPWVGPRWPWLWILFFILTIYPSIEGVAFQFTDTLNFYLNLIISAFLLFWLGNIIAKDMSAVRRVFQGLAVLGTFFAVHTLIQALTGKFLFESADAQATLTQYANFQLQAGIDRIGSFFGNPNGDASYLSASLFLSLGLFIESKRLWAKLLYLLETLLMLAGLMFTYSNAGWVAAGAGLLLFVLLTGNKRSSILLVSLIAILAAIVFALFPTQIAAQFSHASDQGEVSLHTGDWQTALRVIEAFPLFGVGLGTQAYLAISNSYRVPAQTVLLAEPDNSYLQWGAMAGIPTMLVFLALLGMVFWFAWRNWWIVEGRYRSLLGGGIAALISLSITSLSADVWTSTTDLSHLGWLIAGVVTSPLIGRTLLHKATPEVDRTAIDGPVQAEKTSHVYQAKQES